MKRGMSELISNILLIILVLSIIGTVWSISYNLFFGKGKFVEAQSRLLSTRLDLVKVNSQNLSNFEVIVSRYSGKLRIEEVNIYPGQTPSDFDLISVVDISGSMYSKLTPLKVASKNLAELINEGDIRIGFVAYSVSFLPSYSTDLIKDIIILQSVADSWSSQTTTCICCGINQAKNNFLNQSSPGRAKAMVLMSDGIANEKCLEQGTGNANEGGGQYFKAANGTELIKIYDQIGDEIKIKYKSIETYVRLSVVFYNETDVYIEERKLPEVLETKKYSFDLSKMNNVTLVEIYSVAIDYQGKEITRNFVESIELN